MELNEINIYCDESCHLEHDEEHIMLVSCLSCPKKEAKKIAEDLRKIKKKHGLWEWTELKWVKVSKSKEDYYIELINYFFENKSLKFRSVIIPNKEKLNHEDRDQTHSVWYYKMIYLLVKYLPEYIYSKKDKYNVFIDKKEHSYEARNEVLKLKECLDRHFQSDFLVQNIISEQSELLQLNDFLQGAISYYNRGLYKKEILNTKQKIINILSKKLELQFNNTNSSKKFNIFVWEAS